MSDSQNQYCFQKKSLFPCISLKTVAFHACVKMLNKQSLKHRTSIFSLWNSFCLKCVYAVDTICNTSYTIHMYAGVLYALCKYNILSHLILLCSYERVNVSKKPESFKIFALVGARCPKWDWNQASFVFLCICLDSVRGQMWPCCKY